MKRINKLIVFIFFFLLSGLSLLAWQQIYLPLNSSDVENRVFLVEKGQSLFQIASGLEREGLIKNEFLFNFFVILRGAQTKLQAGEYSLSPSMNVTQIAKKFILGETMQIKVTIPEGFTLKQIESELSSELQRTILCQFSPKDFNDEFDFFKDALGGGNLEGFLFPDTYHFSIGATEEEIFRKFLVNFDKKLTPDLRQEVEKQDKTIFEIITMASLLEKEVKSLEEKKLASGILWKRLKNNIPLQVDATIIYITGKKTTKVSKEETQIDSPYNTYKYIGLPLGPICNPGLESIKASIYPEISEHWYYLSTPKGETIFSKTLEEHNIAKAKYLK